MKKLQDRKTPVAIEFSDPGVKLALAMIGQKQAQRRKREPKIPTVDHSNPSALEEWDRAGWRDRLDANGFANFTSKPEGGSTEPARQTNWDRERLGVLRGACFPSQGAFSRFLGNLRRHLGGIPTVAEARKAVELHQGGLPWREHIPAGQARHREAGLIVVEGITFTLLGAIQGPLMPCGRLNPEDPEPVIIRDCCPIQPSAKPAPCPGWILADVSGWKAGCWRRWAQTARRGKKQARWIRVFGIPANGGQDEVKGALGSFKVR